MNALCYLPGCRIQAVLRPDPTTLHLVVTPLRHTTCRCPACGQVSRSGHGHHHRHAADRPCFERRVSLTLRLRRFLCRNPACPRRTFAQRPDALLAPRAQRTRRLVNAQAAVGAALGGEAGARLLDQLGMAASAATVLRTVRALPMPCSETPRVVGVDDWAMKRSVTYGAILVDLERRRVVDLLADRSTATLAGWLQPRAAGIEIHRPGPFHRVRPGSEPGCSTSPAGGRPLALAPPTPNRPLNAGWPAFTVACGACRRPAAVSRNPPGSASSPSRAGAPNGPSVPPAGRAGGRSTGRCTAATPPARGCDRSPGRWSLAGAPCAASPTPAASPSARCVRRNPAALIRIWPGCRSRWPPAGTTLPSSWRELRGRGFAGGPRQVQHWVSQRRMIPSKHTPYGRRPVATSPVAAVGVSASSSQRLPSPKQLAWLLLQPASRRSDAETALIARVERDAEVSRVADLLRDFTALVSASGCHRRVERPSSAAVDRFDDWLGRASTSGVAALATFAAGLRQDGVTVCAALTLPWSSGQAEGQINRLKMIKRQMYGRANFDLLRRRVLLAT